MRKKKILILLFLFWALYASSQEVILSFPQKSIKIPLKDSIKTANSIRIRVDSLPGNGYKILINKKDSILDMGSAPSLFSILEFGDGFNSLLNGLTPSTVRQLSSALNLEFAINYLKLQKENGGDKSKNNNVNPLAYFESLFRYIIYLNKFHFEFRDSVIDQTNEILYKVSKKQYDTIKFIRDAESVLKERILLEKQFADTLLNYYQENLRKYSVINEVIELHTLDSMINAYKNGFSKYLDKYDSVFNKQTVAIIYNQLKEQSKVKNFISFPYQINSDITNFTVDIVPADPKNQIQEYSTSFTINKHPNKFWGFSSGVFVSSLKSKEFSILTITRPRSNTTNIIDTVGYKIVDDEGSNLSAGINALLNVGTYFKETSTSGIYISFGPGLTLEKTPQPRILLGTGFVFGRSNKLMVGFGWIGGPVKRLRKSYNLSDTYSPAPTDIVRDTFKGSYYFSISYSLFGK